MRSWLSATEHIGHQQHTGREGKPRFNEAVAQHHGRLGLYRLRSDGTHAASIRPWLNTTDDSVFHAPRRVGCRSLTPRTTIGYLYEVSTLLSALQ